MADILPLLTSRERVDWPCRPPGQPVPENMKPVRLNGCGTGCVLDGMIPPVPSERSRTVAGGTALILAAAFIECKSAYPFPVAVLLKRFSVQLEADRRLPLWIKSGVKFLCGFCTPLNRAHRPPEPGKRYRQSVAGSASNAATAALRWPLVSSATAASIWIGNSLRRAQRRRIGRRRLIIAVA